MILEHCYLNDDNSHCKYMENREVFDEEVQMNLDCAWCILHDVKCKDKNYHCSGFKKEYVTL